MYKLTVLLAILLSSTFSFAGSDPSKDLKIRLVSMSVNSDDVNVFTHNNSDLVNPANCSKADRIIFRLADSYRNNRVIASITTAAATKQTVLFYIYDDRCVEKSNGHTYPQGVSIQLK